MRRWVSTVVLLSLAVGTAIVLRQFDDDSTVPVAATGDSPDFFMENFESTVMGLDGKPVRILRAVRMLHFPDSGTRELETPWVTLFNAERTPWNIRSEQGRVPAGGDVIFMLGDVHAWRKGPDGARLVDVYTRNLSILPNTEYGESDTPSTIVTPSQTSVGVGMRAYLAESRIELLSRVKTEVKGKVDGT